MDVSMNACGVVAEIVENRPLMGSFHGSYSIAAALAALIGSSLGASGWCVYICYAVLVCVVLFCVVLCCSVLCVSVKSICRVADILISFKIYYMLLYSGVH